MSRVGKAPADKLTQTILDLSPPHVMGQSFVFVYKGQRPNLALYVHKGEVFRGSEKLSVGSEGQGAFFAFNEFVENRPYLFDLKVLKNARVSLIDRCVANEIINFKAQKTQKQSKT